MQPRLVSPTSGGTLRFFVNFLSHPVARKRLTACGTCERLTPARYTRFSCAIGRLGEAEFAVIAPATGPEGALRLVHRLTRTVESATIPVRGGERSVRVQAGYCAVRDFAESTVDAVELLLRATTALRDLKREGDSERVRAFEQVPLQYPN